MSLTYEDCKKLKDAGFPQKSEMFITHPKIGIEILGTDKDASVSYPSLSELIEACGEEFDELRALRMNGKIESYHACSFTLGICLKGSTPSEAVANLWLALQANNHTV